MSNEIENEEQQDTEHNIQIFGKRHRKIMRVRTR